MFGFCVAASRLTLTQVLIASWALSLVYVPYAKARPKEVFCTWKGVSEDRLSLSDTWLYRDDDPRIGAAVAEHLPLGLPGGTEAAGNGEHLLAQPDFVIWYDDDLRAPLWTAHHLTREEARITPTNGGEKRRDSFRSDPRLSTESASTCADYKEPIFDQGHMVPNADLDVIRTGMIWSAQHGSHLPDVQHDPTALRDQSWTLAGVGGLGARLGRAGVRYLDRYGGNL